jgi:prolipoprotein diacylglyceryltransferase
MFFLHFPVLWELGSFSLSAHLLFETLAFILGFRLFLFLRKRNGDTIEENNRLIILGAAIFGSFLFSRLIGSLENPPLWFSSEHPLLHFLANKTILGGLLGGLLTVELVKWILGEKRSSGDLFTYPLLLAIAIGRIGCFLNGVTEPVYGYETTLFTGMDLGDGILRHPLALYEILFLISLAGILLFVERRVSLKEGFRFQLFLLLYCVFRFSMEFLKPDSWLFFGMSTIQWTALMGIVYYYRMIIRLFSPSTLFVNDYRA